MKTVYRVLFFVGVACHFTLVAGFNIRSIADGISAVYGFIPFPEPIARQLSHILDGDGVVHYSVLTGVRMGYGFYAPQVGSPYTLALESSTSNHISDTAFTAGLRTAVGHMRFTMLLDFFQYVERGDRNRDGSHLAEALVTHLAERHRQLTGADHVVCRVFRLRPPTFRRSKRGITWLLVYSSNPPSDRL